MEKKRKSSGQSSLFGFYPRSPRVGDVLAGSVSEEMEELTEEGRDFRNVGEDSLGEIFSHLSQKDLLEVMMVCKAWENTVCEGSAIWKEVDVYKKWHSDSGGWGTRGGETRHFSECSNTHKTSPSPKLLKEIKSSSCRWA